MSRHSCIYNWALLPVITGLPLSQLVDELSPLSEQMRPPILDILFTLELRSICFFGHYPSSTHWVG